MKAKGLLRQIMRPLAAAKATISAVRDYRQGRSISHLDWERILAAHCASNGRFTELLMPVLRQICPRRPDADASGLLGHFSVKDQKRIADHIARDGYYIFESRMPDPICAAIEKLARNCPAYREDEFGVSDQPELYDSAAPSARLYKLREADSLTEPAVQALMADDALLRISEMYLQTRTVVGGIDIWWSAPYGNGPSSEAAQLFHFDFDAPPHWLKLFVYVTPVGPENGPHIFVRGSHKAGMPAAAELIGRGYARIPDNDIERAYGKDAPVEIIGPRGTVFLADTRGFHKGKHPTCGDRLMCQILYCSPVFSDHGGPPQHTAHFTPELAAAIRSNPAAYARYISSQKT